MINNFLNNYENSNKGFVSTLDSYSINELINLYITYSHAKYFIEHDNMEEILNYISSYIIRNLPNLSFLEVGELYSKISVKEKDIKKALENNRNIITNILYESKNEFYIEFNAKAKGMDVETYKENRNKELKVYKEFEEQWTPVHSILNTFKNDILSYLNIYVCSISETEKDSLLKEINKAIEDNSRKIKNGMELRLDKKKVAIQSRFKDVQEMNDLYEKMNTSELEQQNYIYLNFQSVLNSLNKGNSK